MAVWSQRVRVEPEVTAYPNGSVNLRCEFTDSGSTKLTQVSWMFERVEGDRHNIAVFHPQYGASFPNKDFDGRVSFTRGSLENPSIRIDKLRMADAGRYICEYATYPSGNEQGTTTLIMLASSPLPHMSASTHSFELHSQCRIYRWMSLTFFLDPPTVTIEGYDNNWYMGRTDAVLTCQADANPAPTDVSWTVASGQLPPSVQVDQNRLLVRKVDETVNTTFVCEVKNSLGSGKKELVAMVIEEHPPDRIAGVVAGAILGSFLALILVGALVTVLVMRSRRHQHRYSGDGEQGAYGNKTRLFGGKKGSKNGAGANNNGPIYTYRESEPGTLTEKCNEFPRITGSTPSAHDILLSGEMNEAERRKFDALNDSLEDEEDDERYDRFSGLPPSYQIHGHEDECTPYLDDDMESQRDGSIISRTAIYV
uniref:PVR cell adhesion molecule related 2 like n=1 Tax=Cyprinus carpio TaxID=7962 RepID=A0A8C2HVQ0_CYPCA